MNWHTTAQTEQATLKRSLLYIGSTVVLAMMLLIGCLQPVPGSSPETSQTTSHASWPAPQLGVVVDENMKVVDLDPHNAAKKAGIQVGDILLSVDGVPFTEKEKAKALITESPGESVYEEAAKGSEWKGKTIRLQLQRNGEVIELEIMPAPPIWDPAATVTPAWPPLDYF